MHIYVTKIQEKKTSRKNRVRENLTKNKVSTQNARDKRPFCIHFEPCLLALTSLSNINEQCCMNIEYVCVHCVNGRLGFWFKNRMTTNRKRKIVAYRRTLRVAAACFFSRHAHCKGTHTHVQNMYARELLKKHKKMHPGTLKFKCKNE